MKAGRELDALVAEKVFGWTGCAVSTGGVKQNFECLYGHDPSRPERDYWFVPHYSTEIEPASRVILNMRERESLHMIDPEIKMDHHGPILLPHVICLVALKALGVEIPA